MDEPRREDTRKPERTADPKSTVMTISLPGEATITVTALPDITAESLAVVEMWLKRCWAKLAAQSPPSQP